MHRKDSETFSEWEKKRYNRLMNEEKLLCSTVFKYDLDQIKRYERLSYEQQMFEREALITEGFDTNLHAKALEDINNLNFIKDDYDSYLSQYRKDTKKNNLTSFVDSDEMKGNKYHTYQVPNVNAGFFIGEDGYIGGLYNNSSFPNLGQMLMQAGEKLGGTFFDHFDGRLSYLYDRKNIPVIGHDIWDDSHKPEEWDYEPLNARDIHYFYGKQFQNHKNDEQLPQELIGALKRYAEGKPDIIFRGKGNDIR